MSIGIHFRWSQWFKTRTGCGSRCREACWWWWSGCSWLQNTCTVMRERERQCCGQLNHWTDGDRNVHACPCIANTWPGHSFPVITMCTCSSASAVQAILRYTKPETNHWCRTCNCKLRRDWLIDCNCYKWCEVIACMLHASRTSCVIRQYCGTPGLIVERLDHFPVTTCRHTWMMKPFP